jgi:hypothetical protein
MNFEVKNNISRKVFINFTTGVILSYSFLNGEEYKQGDSKEMNKNLIFSSLNDVLKFLGKIENIQNPKITGEWDVNQVLHHCAQSIEYSITGYPENKNILIQKTIGKIVLYKFLSQGYMSHNLNDPIPGAESLPPSKNNINEGIKRLKDSIEAFQKHTQKLAPHFVYGEVSKQDYERVHAMHVANHFSAIDLSYSE